MSNYYAKAVNPRTNKLEKAVVLDMGKYNFIQFEDGWKHNLKFFNGDVITEDEQEAVNKDGEEVIDEFEAYFGDPQTTKEVFATLSVSILMTGLLAVMLVGVVNCVQYIWRVIERVI